MRQHEELLPPGPARHDAIRDPARLVVLEASGILDAPGELVFDRLVRIASLATGSPMSLVSFVAADREFLMAQTGTSEDLLACRETPLSHSFCQHVVALDAPLVVEDARTHPLVCDNGAIDDLGVVAYAGVPIRVRGQVLGAVCTIAPEPRDWSDADLALLEELADAASTELALRSATADALDTDALEGSVLRELPELAVFRFDTELTYTFADGEAFRAAGWKPEQLVGYRVEDAIPPGARAVVLPNYVATVRGERRAFTFDDEQSGLSWAVQTAPVRDASGDLAGGIAVARDVTEARRRDAALAESELEHRLLAEHSTDIMARIDPDGRFVYMSAAATRVLGYDTEAAVGTHFLDWVHPSDRSGVETFGRILAEASGPLVSTPYRVRRHDGSWAWLECSAVRIEPGDGAPAVVQCAYRDVSMRLEVEARLSETEELNRSLVESLESGVLVLAQDGRVLMTNPAAEAALGLEAGALVGQRLSEAPWTYIAEDGSPLTIDELPVTRAIATNRPQRGVIGLHTEDGSIRWQSASAAPLSRHAPDGAETADAAIVSFTDITDIKQAGERARHAAMHDGLTGLANRELLLESLRHAVHERRPLALLLLDLDEFKLVNDGFGHAEGDRLLREAAGRVLDAVRPDDVVARLGGDEFAVVCHGIDQDGAARSAAERVLAALEEPFTVGDQVRRVTASIGCRVYHPDEGLVVDDVDALLRDADVAMYEAKGAGRDRVELFSEDTRLRLVERLDLEHDLARGIREDELVVHYQPHVDLVSERIVGVEALVRWQHPTRGFISPAEFIPVAENSGQIVAVGDVVLEQACNDLAGWLRTGLGELTVAVNISAHQLQDPGFADRVISAGRLAGIPPRLLCLEVTESSLMDASGSGVDTLRSLRDEGFYVAIDDFGTGYSSLSYLKRLPVDVLKIDRSFVDGLGVDDDDSAIVTSILSLAQAMGLHVVAEGIETVAQAEELRALGCTIGQGFLFSPAVPPEHIIDLVTSHPSRTRVLGRGGRRANRDVVEEVMYHVGIPEGGR